MTTETEVIEVGSNSTGAYYRLNLRTKGEMVAPITVKHSTRFNTMVCLTCVTADSCAHARLVRRYVEEHAPDQQATEQVAETVA
jgi:hypothetical protein